MDTTTTSNIPTWPRQGTTAMRDFARSYHEMGFQVVPVGVRTKLPTMAWEPLQVEQVPLDDCMGFGWSGRGIAMVNGVNGLRTIDIDKIVQWGILDQLLSALGLPPEYQWLSKSGSQHGAQLFFRSVDRSPKSVSWWFPLNGGDDQPFDHMELRWIKSITVLPPSPHSSGHRYGFLHGSPDDLPASLSYSKVFAALSLLAVERQPQDEHKAKASSKKWSADEPTYEPGNELDSPQALKILEKLCADLAAAPQGCQTTTLNKMAYTAGGYIGGGHLAYRTAYDQLMDACRSNGLLSAKGEKTVRDLENGLDAGMASPLHPTQKDRTSSNGTSAAANDVNDDGKLYNLTDLGNAERFATRYKDTVRWCEDWKCWLIFNGKYWERDRSGYADRYAKMTIRSIYAEAAQGKDEKECRAIAKHAMASESNRAVRAMLDRAKCELPISPDEFDQHLYLLNFQNGTFDLRTGELHPHRAEDRLTKCLKVNYNPTASRTKWEAFISSIFAANKDLIAFIKMALGMSLTGDLSEQCLFLCHGGGSNGKTTMLETVRKLLGCYGHAANIETFQVRSIDHINNDVAELYGARFVTAEETTIGGRLNEAFIKKATGNQPLRARRLHENEFEFMPQFTLWFAVNHKPVVKDSSKGMWRRVHFIPFTVTFEGEQVKQHLLKELLHEEAEGIMAWLVEGCLEWIQQGRLVAPQVVQDATRSYRDEMDIIGRYLDACTTQQRNARVGATVLYTNYKKWCEETGEHWEKQKTFGDQLTERGFVKEKTRTGYEYIGIGLLAQDVPPDDHPPHNADPVNDVNDVNDDSEFTSGENETSQFTGDNRSHRSHRSQDEESPDDNIRYAQQLRSQLQDYYVNHDKHGSFWTLPIKGWTNGYTDADEVLKRIDSVLSSGNVLWVMDAVAFMLGAMGEDTRR